MSAIDLIKNKSVYRIVSADVTVKSVTTPCCICPFVEVELLDRADRGAAFNEQRKG